MLTAADEWHVHQMPEPIAVAGTDRNFYDRSYFGGWTPDGELFFALAFGIYPHLNIADAHLTIVRGGRQHCLHASKVLHSDRATLAVGPVSIEIERPLWALRVRVAETEGLGADLRFEGRHFPIEEPRFTYRFGPRAFMDYTRMSQGARVSGALVVDGQRLELPEGTVGMRDRSWGIRPIGLGDPQPVVPEEPPQFFWLWAPVHFAAEVLFWHANEDREGRAWNTRGELAADGRGAGGLRHAAGTMDVELVPGTRWVARGTLAVRPQDGAPFELAYEPVAHLEMQGIGYRHPTWVHGGYRGKELDVAREDVDLDASSPGDLHRWHRQLLCRVRRTGEDGSLDEGMGLLEHLFIGEHAPLGLR
ncbi:MAG TPA: hypothetical protein VD931_05830 [Baekduia sp.]|nr:hypothetical protein [Baekduia sp.]